MHKSVIIFDFDGTLADTIPLIYEIANLLAAKHKISEIDKKQFEKYRGMSPFELIKSLPIPFYEIPFFINEGRRLLKEKIGTAHLFSGMKDVLKELKNKKYELGIATSNTKPTVLSFLDKNNLSMFSFVYAEENIFGKNALLNEVLKKEHIARDKTIYVTDEVRDIQACSKIGLDVAAVTWGFNNRGILEKYHPVKVVDSPNELLTFL